jgi:hypothetical protein
MKTLFALAATGTLLLSGIASAKGFPFYELSGFPISPHQISVLGATGNLKEQPPSASLTMDGMPASPHQILVLTPRRRISLPVRCVASPGRALRQQEVPALARAAHQGASGEKQGCWGSKAP